MLSLNIILIISTAIVFVESGIPKMMKALINNITKWNLKRLKPFDCTLCMGFWIGLAFHHSSIEDIMIAFFCAFLSELTYRLYKLIPISI